MKFSLKTQVASFITLIILVVSVISTGLFIFTNSRSIEREIISRGSTLTLSLAKAAAEGLATENLDLLKKAAHIIQADDVELAQVYSSLWQAVDSFPLEKINEPPDPGAVEHFKVANTPFYIKHNNRYVFYGPILFKPLDDLPGVTIGFTKITLSSLAEQQTVKSAIIANVALSVLITLLSIASINILINRLVIKPVMGLHDSIKMLGKGELPYVVPARAAVEIRDLALEFNKMGFMISERKRAQEELRESEERLSLALKAAGQSIYDSNLQTGETIVSPEYALMLGYDPAEFQETTAKWIKRLHPDDRGPVSTVYRAYSKGEIPEYKVEFRLKTKGGDWKWILSLGKIIERDADGNPLRLIGTYTDISKRKRAEAERNKFEEQLHHAQKMEGIGVLAGGVAHDFNNILTAIIGYGSLAHSNVAGDPITQKYIQEVLDAAQRAEDLTKRLLAFSRKQVIEPVLADLNEIVRDIEKMLRRIITEDIELSTAMSAGKLPVLVDIGQMEQVLMNLAANARDAMPNGGHLVIQTDLVNVDDSYAKAHIFENTGMYAVLTVSDTGVGMDQSTKENIFEPFFTTKEVGKGTGLGLSMVYGIIKQHNGNVNVYSEVGKGSTFRIYLPMAEKKGEAVSKPVETLAGGKGETIIIAEDEPQVRKIMMTLLQETGYKIIEAENGEDAVRKFRENRGAVSLMLLDVIMPVKNGREAYKEIKVIEPGIKAIFMSGYTDDIITKKGILEEGFDFISKPVHADVLIRKIRDVLDR